MKTRKLFVTILFTALFGGQLMANQYEIKKELSEVQWTGKKVAGKHYGTIRLQKGVLQVEAGKILGGTMVMDMTSIVNEDLENESLNKKLVEHLESDDFFSVDQYPVSTLELKEVTKRSEKTYLFSGDLTIKGITHPVAFEAETTMSDGRITSEGTIKIDRTLYDIKYGSGKFFENLGDNMINDTFTIDFSVVAYAAEGAESSAGE